jgi:hypothetical protein
VSVLLRVPEITRRFGRVRNPKTRTRNLLPETAPRHDKQRSFDSKNGRKRRVEPKVISTAGCITRHVCQEVETVITIIAVCRQRKSSVRHQPCGQIKRDRLNVKPTESQNVINYNDRSVIFCVVSVTGHFHI